MKSKPKATELERADKRLRPTYSSYMFYQLFKVWPKGDEDEFEITSVHYTAKGIMAHITDKTDSQKYIMEIYPDER